MDNAEIAEAIRLEINKAEAALAKVAELATPEFRSTFPEPEISTAFEALQVATSAVKDFHAAALACANAHDDEQVRSGGGGK